MTRATPCKSSRLSSPHSEMPHPYKRLSLCILLLLGGPLIDNLWFGFTGSDTASALPLQPVIATIPTRAAIRSSAWMMVFHLYSPAIQRNESPSQKRGRRRHFGRDQRSDRPVPRMSLTGEPNTACLQFANQQWEHLQSPGLQAAEASLGPIQRRRRRERH